MLKEIDFFGIFISPFVAYLIMALIIFFPVRILFDRYTIQHWVWHRPLFDISVFTIILCLLGLLF